ncbi:MAG TPA: condensation domain-containing protein, partial [Polyangiaceae bacterium]|nr:condensation domain-containing protein [Polyangiaceae bacterium]
MTGDWITAEQATSPRYWADHLRKAVRFSDGLLKILEKHPAVLLEVGPGQALTTLARQHRDAVKNTALVPSMRHPLVEAHDGAQLMSALGALWAHGVNLDWTAVHGGPGMRRRVPLPTYAFQRKRYWLPPVYVQGSGQTVSATLSLDHGAQPVHEIERSERHEAPRDAVERDVAAIWERMLGLSGIGIHDDFFKLGGHSLLATQLVAEIRRTTDTEISVQILFKDPTIAGLAAQIRELKAQNPDYQAKTIPLIARGGNLPLTFHQSAVWDFEHRFPGSARFNGVINLRLLGDLDLDAMHFAIDEILRRHEVLRTSYTMRKGKASAVIRPARHLDVPFHDLSGLSPEQRQQRLLHLANAQLRQPFDLRKDIYIRPTLIRIAPREHLLVIVSHYVAVDGWTIGLVIQEFGVHYTAYRKPDAPRLPDLAFQVVDYADWERKRMTEEALASHLQYWEKQLADLPQQQPVPTDRARPLFPTLRGATHHLSLGPQLTEKVKAFSKAKGYTAFMVFVAALDVL